MNKFTLWLELKFENNLVTPFFEALLLQNEKKIKKPVFTPSTPFHCIFCLSMKFKFNATFTYQRYQFTADELR